LILNVVLVGAPVASHENDQVELPPNRAMEDADWVHERSRSVRSMDAPTLMWLNGYFVNIWTTNMGFTWR
jgi:hypothetical protein